MDEELDQNALNEQIKEEKRRLRLLKKEEKKKISGKVVSEDFTAAIGEIQKESLIPSETILKILVESMKQSYLEWAYPGLFNHDRNLSTADILSRELINCEIVFNDKHSKFQIFDIKTVTNDEDIIDDAYQISPEDYTELTQKTAEVGETVKIPFDVKQLDKSYVRRVKQLFQGKLKEASKQSVYSAYKDQMNDIIEGVVTRADIENGEYEISFGKSVSSFKKNSPKLLPNDSFVQGERVLFYLEKVGENMNHPVLDVSRTCAQFVEKLMMREIPELKEGLISIKGIAREPGKRTKVFVESNSANIDAVGACIGPESSRQRTLTTILRNEKIDILKYSTNKAIQIIEAMKPAEVIGLTCPDDFFDPSVHYEEFENDKEYVHPLITAIVNNGAQGVAIGSNGCNVRLASRITKCKLTVLQIDDAMKNGVKAMMTPDILKAAGVVVESIPNKVEIDEEIDEEEVLDEEVKPVDEVNTTSENKEVEEEVSVEETNTPILTEEVKVENVGEEVKEEEKEEVKADVKEEIEHVEITNKPKINLDDIEASLGVKKGNKETKSYKKKKKVEEKVSAPSLASQATAMPIYTEEELQEMENENNEDSYSDYDEELDEEYDDYYDDEK